MARIIHYDEASTAITAIVNNMLGLPWLARAAIIDDLFGSFHLVFWLRSAGDIERLDADWPAIEQRVVEACAGFWAGHRLVTSEDTPSLDHDICQRAWDAWLECHMAATD